jgi:hypothetical protein
MAELGATTAQVNALQSLATAPAAAPVSIPQVQHTPPPQANMGDELIAPPAGGTDE